MIIGGEEMAKYKILKDREIYDENLQFTGERFKKIKYFVKEYISELTKQDSKVFLLDSFWSRQRYLRFKDSRYRKEIERRYHMKLSVDDFLNKDDIFEYMNHKEVNIMKVKSIEGYMSAAELFTVIVSKINEDLSGDERAYILINDFILEHLDEGEFLDLYMRIDKERIKFFVLNNKEDLPRGLQTIINKIIEVD